MNRRVFLKSSFATLALSSAESIAGTATSSSQRQFENRSNANGLHGKFLWHASGVLFSQRGRSELPDDPTAGSVGESPRANDRFFAFGPWCKGGHFGVHSFLSGVREEDAKGLPEGNITIDQRAAEHVGSQTRFPSLTVGIEDGLHGGVGCVGRGPEYAFLRYRDRGKFTESSSSMKTRTRARGRPTTLRSRSILDSVMGEAKSLERRLGERQRKARRVFLFGKGCRKWFGAGEALESCSQTEAKLS